MLDEVKTLLLPKASDYSWKPKASTSELVRKHHLPSLPWLPYCCLHSPQFHAALVIVAAADTPLTPNAVRGGHEHPWDVQFREHFLARHAAQLHEIPEPLDLGAARLKKRLWDIYLQALAVKESQSHSLHMGGARIFLPLDLFGYQ